MSATVLPLIPGQGLQGVYPPFDANYETLVFEGAFTTYPDGNGSIILPPTLEFAAASVALNAGGLGYHNGDDLTVVGLGGANGTGSAITVHVTYVSSTFGVGRILGYYVTSRGAYTVQPTDQAGDIPPVGSGIYAVSGGAGAGALFQVTWNSNGLQRGSPLPIVATPAPELYQRKIYAFAYAQQAGGVTGNLGISVDLYRPNIPIPQRYPLLSPSTAIPQATVPSFFTGKGSVYSVTVAMQYALNIAADPLQNNISPFLITTPIDNIVMRFDYANGWVGDPSLPLFAHYYFSIISSH